MFIIDDAKLNPVTSAEDDLDIITRYPPPF